MAQESVPLQGNEYHINTLTKMSDLNSNVGAYSPLPSIWSMGGIVLVAVTIIAEIKSR